MKWSRIGRLSDAGRGFFAPKKPDGVGARDGVAALTLDCGLEAALGSAVSGNVMAAGLNSIALTLKRLEVAEVGVGAPL